MRTAMAGVSMRLILASIGCSGGHASSGSVPVKTITTPSHTETLGVPSSAKEPTLHCARPGIGCESAANDEIVVEEAVRDVKRGDILVFLTPPAAQSACNASGKFVKRLIGLPGDTVREDDGSFFINDTRLKEPYVKPASRDHQSGTWHVPQGQYFFMGDNRREACDSRR